MPHTVLLYAAHTFRSCRKRARKGDLRSSLHSRRGEQPLAGCPGRCGMDTVPCTSSVGRQDCASSKRCFLDTPCNLYLVNDVRGKVERIVADKNFCRVVCAPRLPGRVLKRSSGSCFWVGEAQHWNCRCRHERGDLTSTLARLAHVDTIHVAMSKRQQMLHEAPLMGEGGGNTCGIMNHA